YLSDGGSVKFRLFRNRSGSSSSLMSTGKHISEVFRNLTGLRRGMHYRNSSSQSISPLENTTHAAEDQTVTLSCKYEYSNKVYLHWYRQYPGSRPEFLLLKFEGSAAVTHAVPRFPRLDVNNSKDTVNLTISSAAVADSALYYCALVPTVTGNPDTLNLLTILIITSGVFGADVIRPSDDQKTDVVGTEGEPLTLKCSYDTSSEAVRLYWYRQYPNRAPQYLLYRGARLRAEDLIAATLQFSELKISSLQLYRAEDLIAPTLQFSELKISSLQLYRAEDLIAPTLQFSELKISSLQLCRIEHKSQIKIIRLTPTPGEVPLSVTPAEVRRTLRRINPRKSAGPDNIPGRVLRECADQISEVLADIFNVSLTQAAVPTCMKTATIIPVPKSSTVTSLNDYRQIALTPIVTKCFERLVMTHIKATIDVTVDPHQYAYRRNRSTDDAISSVVHTALTHLEQKDSYVRMLFVDFTSAFNTMIPQTLTDKLSSLGLRSSLCNWVLDFLTNRPQSVRIHNLSSSTTILSTGSPQGCVLSPLLFTLLTYDCSPIHPGCHIVKFADDTAVAGCITNSDESGYRQEVEHLEGWCRKNNLCINIKKTKEMIVDFRRGRHAHLPLHVGGSAVEVVSSYRYLGVHLSNNLTWSNNTSSLVRKAHQRLYFLRRLRRAGLGSSVLTSFYRCVVESVLCSSISVWHGSCSAADRKALQRLLKAAQKSVGVSLPTTTDIYTSRCRKRATCIMKDATHPAHSHFVPLPSGRRLRSIKCKTNRLRNSFIPEAVKDLDCRLAISVPGSFSYGAMMLEIHTNTQISIRALRAPTHYWFHLIIFTMKRNLLTILIITSAQKSFPEGNRENSPLLGRLVSLTIFLALDQFPVNGVQVRKLSMNDVLC
ncbi:hypothetical protein NFI96_006373, partial [Prochilodus magdalenae]